MSTVKTKYDTFMINYDLKILGINPVCGLYDKTDTWLVGQFGTIHKLNDDTYRVMQVTSRGEELTDVKESEALKWLEKIGVPKRPNGQLKFVAKHAVSGLF